MPGGGRLYYMAPIGGHKKNLYFFETERNLVYLNAV